MLVDKPQAFTLARRQQLDRIFGREHTRGHDAAS
jgi:hypothetical protein